MTKSKLFYLWAITALALPASARDNSAFDNYMRKNAGYAALKANGGRNQDAFSAKTPYVEAVDVKSKTVPRNANSFSMPGRSGTFSNPSSQASVTSNKFVPIEQPKIKMATIQPASPTSGTNAPSFGTVGVTPSFNNSTGSTATAATAAGGGTFTQAAAQGGGTFGSATSSSQGTYYGSPSSSWGVVNAQVGAANTAATASYQASQVGAPSPVVDPTLVQAQAQAQAQQASQNAIQNVVSGVRFSIPGR